MLENQIGKRYAEALSGNIGDDSQLGVALKKLERFWRSVENRKSVSAFF